MREKLASIHIALWVQMVQVGVVLFRFPQLEAQHFGTNGWASLLVCFAAASFNMWLIKLVLNKAEGKTIFEIMEGVLPKPLLFVPYLMLVGAWGMFASLAAKEYVHILKLVSFPVLAPIYFMVVLGLLAFYLLTKGIYVMAKTATMYFFLVVWMSLLITYFFQDFDFARLTPFLFRESHQPLRGLLDVYSVYLGYELILLLIPYKSSTAKPVKAAFGATAFTTLQLLYLSIMCFGIFSLDQLKKTLFPLLDLLAYIKFPFMERIENLFYGFFLFMNIIASASYYWSASLVGERIAPKLGNKPWALLIIVICTCLSLVPVSLMETEKWLRFAGYACCAAAFVLPMALLVLLFIQKRKAGASRDQT